MTQFAQASDTARAPALFGNIRQAMRPALLQSRGGTQMPHIIYGTAWKKEQTAGFVARALTLGFRGIDTACQPKHYDEPGVGRGLASWLQAGGKRDELYLQTKFTPLSGQDPKRIPYSPRASLTEQVRESCAASLRNLGVRYLDTLVLHSPIEPFAHTLEVWREFEALVQRGLVRELGISNCYDPSVLRALCRSARVKPWVVQNRFYARTGYDPGIRQICREHGLVYQSFWTLSANPHLLAHPTFTALAERYSASPAQLMFNAVSRLGGVPLTGTTSEAHMRQSLQSFDFELQPAELDALTALLA